MLVINPNEFGAYLKSLRNKKGITLDELGEQTELSKAHLSNLENGRRGVPSPDLLKKLSDPLSVDHMTLMIMAGHIEGRNQESSTLTEGDSNLSELGGVREVVSDLILKKELNQGRSAASFTVRFAYSDNKRLEHIGSELGISKQEFIAKVTMAALMEAELRLGLASQTEKGIEYSEEYLNQIRSV